MNQQNRSILYHVGYLLVDRLSNNVVHENAEKFWKRYLDGKVHLVQKKLRYGVYEYWAIPRKLKPRRVPCGL